MKRGILFLVISIILNSCLSKKNKSIDYVNPFIGTATTGHTYPGVCLPFGMAQLSPDTRNTDNWDGCSGYHYSDSLLYGFSHTHISGTGCSDYCDILFLPLNKTDINTCFSKNPTAKFFHSKENASPGYYEVPLEDKRIKVELTATKRCGMHQYSYSSNEKYIYIDLKHRDSVLESSLKITGPNEITGYRRSMAWAKNQVVFFVAQFSEPITSFDLAKNNLKIAGKELNGTNVKAVLCFSGKESNIKVRVGISGVSIDGARMNLKAEMNSWDFDSIKIKAENEWEQVLSKIKVEGTKEQKTKFYTALYHSYLAPNLFMDVDGSYLGRDFKTHKAVGFDYYTTFSIWDTYRALNPLMTIIDQKSTSDFINTFINQYDQGGILPVWELSANETDCMIGYHSVSIIADAYIKGIKGFDSNKALEAMVHSAMQDTRGLRSYKEKGYISGDEEPESVSKTLEYAYDDWCIAQMAKAMGKDTIYKQFMIRAQSWKNVLDPQTLFARARMNGTWYSPFEPAEVNFNYTEANSWQYSMYVPQDMKTLIRYYGGNSKFEQRLDSMFAAPAKTKGRTQVDITGLIGQYAHGNEPSHHVAFLYNVIGKPTKTQSLVRKIQDNLYSSNPDGLCGNDDCGQMSAWYVLSSMGIYAVSPSSSIYQLCSPNLNKATISLENGKTFTFTANRLSQKNKFIKTVKLNGKEYTKSYITHDIIMSGGEIVFEMTDKPNSKWGTKPEDISSNEIIENKITPCPFIKDTRRSFKDSLLVDMTSLEPKSKIYFSVKGLTNISKMILFTKPFVIKEKTTFTLIAVNELGKSSTPITTTYNKIDPTITLKLANKYSPLYSAGGDNALIDLIEGKSDFRTGVWQGYKTNLDATVDLGKVRDIRSFGIHFVQDQNAWIFMPLYVDLYTSTDGVKFKLAEHIETKTNEKTDGSIIETYEHKTNEKIRYIRVLAKTRGKCPDWHKGKGGESWIFADEIYIRDSKN